MPNEIGSPERIAHMEWAAKVKAEVEQRAVDRGCEDDDANGAAEVCEQYHRKDIGEYCDPCLMGAILGHAKEMEAQVAALQGERDEVQRALERERSAHLRTVDERDSAQQAADDLAYAIAPIEAIGEHSNLNNPWTNALEEITSIKERAEAWGLLNQARELDQQTVAAECARLRGLVPEWRDIDTAPKNGTELLLLTSEGVDIGQWNEAWGPSIDDPGHDAGWIGVRWAFPGCTRVRKESDYYSESMAQPTHWQPLPPAPAGSGKKG